MVRGPKTSTWGLAGFIMRLGRISRPQRVVVIGSFRGFVPLVLARAMRDNLEPGEVIFIDPSLADDFWKDPETVRSYFTGSASTT